MKQYRNLFIILTVALFLTACGGGGGTSLSLESPTQASSGGTSSGGNGSGGSGSGGNGSGSSGVNPPRLAADAQTAAETARDVRDAALETASGPISAIQSKTTLRSAMGVSANIGADQAIQDIATIEGEIAKIKRQKEIAERAVMALEAEAMRLKMEADDLQKQLDTAETELLSLNMAAIDLEGQAGSLRVRLDIFEVEIATDEAAIVTQEESADEDDAEADRLASLNPFDPMITTYREQAEAHRMAAASKRAEIDAIRNDPDYITLKRKTEVAEAVATTKRAETEAKKTEVEQLRPKPAEKINEAADKEDEAEDAKGYVQEINKILVEFEGGTETDVNCKNLNCENGKRVVVRKGVLEGWKEAVGDDAAAAESEKAKLVLDLLSGVDLPLPNDINDITDLDRAGFSDESETFDPDHVFARAENEPVAGAMTFEDIARAGVWEGAGYIFDTRSFLLPDNSVDTAAHAAYDLRNSRNQGGTGLPQNHPVVNLSGLEVANFILQDGSTPSTLDYVRSTEYPVEHGQLNGIDGTLYCDHRNGCITGSGLFGEGWYFTPAVNSSRAASLGYNPAEGRFEDADEDGVYEPVRYVDYGMWLAGDDDNLRLHRRVGLVGPTAQPEDLDFTITSGNTDPSATYEGEARGLSAHTVGTGDDAVTASGHFEANVMLEATFGASPMLAGTIDRFRAVAGQGSGHVNTRWSIRLQPTAITNGEITGGAVTISAPDGDGSWSATAYGDSGERPAGFYGGFTAEFYGGEGGDGPTTGAAVGVYSAE